MRVLYVSIGVYTRQYVTYYCIHMTKKDHELIARVFNGLTQTENNLVWNNSTFELCEGIAIKLAVELKKDNPKFDMQMFRKACGMDEK